MANVFLPLVATEPEFGGAHAPNLGIGIGWQRGVAWTDASLALLQPPLWYDWAATPARLPDPAYLPMCFNLRSCTASERAMQLAASDPGRLWLLGNEPELRTFATEPELAANFVRRWSLLAGHNFAVAGVVAAPEGAAWLDAYLAAGGPVGEYWHVHLYYATSGDEWLERWRWWVDWQATNRVTRPTIVSETNAWPGGDQSDVLATVAATLAADPLLYAVLWYSDNDYWDRFHDPDLRTADGELTTLGVQYRDVLKSSVRGVT